MQNSDNEINPFFIFWLQKAKSEEWQGGEDKGKQSAWLRSLKKLGENINKNAKR